MPQFWESGDYPGEAAINKSKTTDSVQLTDVAIIGMSGRFPGARNIGDFWRNIRDGVESITFFSKEELQEAGVAAELFNRADYVRAKGVLADVELFDASIFRLAPREVEIIDPQQRLFLECSREALESAGYVPEAMPCSVGVYGGVGANVYLLHLLSSPAILETASGLPLTIGNEKDFVTTRVSYKLNLRGPSVGVQTACSTSLVAVHLACQGLLNGECEIALAGGASIRLPQIAGYLYQDGGILSPDGHCRAFDAQAAGCVAGSGAGVVVLKRLEDALRDRDPVAAVIKGSAINNDGILKVGFTAPSVEGQGQAIAEALAIAQVDPETVSYLEAHGTGTPVGDPIEIAAAAEVFRESTFARGWCAVGSVKTNIGHLDAAAGIAGLIKTVLSLQHQRIPPSLHFERSNPAIDFDSSPFYVSARLADWESPKGPRRAGVSSFGIGGTNAHVVLEEAPSRESVASSRSYQILHLSAETASALEKATEDLSRHLSDHPEIELADAAFTLGTGRKFFRHRRALVCRHTEDAQQALMARDTSKLLSHVQVDGERSAAFLFPGQGAQYLGMGHELYRREPVFRQWVDRCFESLGTSLKKNLHRVLRDPISDDLTGSKALDRTDVAQPALFIVEYALARMWMEWGVTPVGMLGHSIGEWVAACLAGVFSLDDALALVATRGRLMQEIPEGAMLAVALAVEELVPRLNETLSVAADNGPSFCTVSGPAAAVDQLRDQLSSEGIEVRPVRVSRAFHSPMMEPAMKDFADQVSRVERRSPQIPFVSNVHGRWIQSEEAADPAYWAEHLRRTVLFKQGLRELVNKPDRVLLECGPGQTLRSLVQQNPAISSKHTVLTSLPTAHGRSASEAHLRRTVARLQVLGVEIEWEGYYRQEQRRRLALPTYPFEKQRYWVAPAENLPGSRSRLERREDPADWYYVPSWRQHFLSQLSVPDESWLILCDAKGLGDRLAEALRGQGQKVTVAQSGEQLLHENDIFFLNATSPADYRSLVRTLWGLDKPPSRVISLLGTRSAKRLDDESSLAGFWGLLYFVQALGDLQISDSLKIFIITDQAYAVTGEEQLKPEMALLAGPAKVIPREYANISCRHIDVVIPQSGDQEVSAATETRLADQLVSELFAGTGDPVVALRRHLRWVQSFQAVRLPPTEKARLSLADDGAVLITGGLGGIGAALAEYLAKTAGVPLVLVGRTVLPESKEWDAWLDLHGVEDEVSLRILRIRQLKEQGADLMVASADVTDEEQMVEVMRRALQRYGRIQGVIHAAGIPGGRLIQLKDPAAVARVLEPKVRGTLVLDKILAQQNVDFFVLCSSLSAFLGGLGQVDYCAANAFLDAFAHWRSACRESSTVSINWDSWREVGMAVATEIPADLREQRESRLRDALLSSEGSEAFGRILSSSYPPQIVVSTRDFESRLKRSRETAGPATQRDVVKDAVSPVLEARERPELSSSYLSPRNDLEGALTKIWEDLLGIHPVGIEDDFFELGGHSLMGLRVLSRIRDTFEVEIAPRGLFERPTVAGLARAIEESLMDDIDELSDEEVEELVAEARNDSLGRDAEELQV